MLLKRSAALLLAAAAILSLSVLSGCSSEEAATEEPVAAYAPPVTASSAAGDNASSDVSGAEAVPSSEPEPSPTPEPTPSPTPEPEARQLEIHVTRPGYELTMLTDGDHLTIQNFNPLTELTVTCEEPMYTLYIEWDTLPLEWTLTVNGKDYTKGRCGFLHEYIILPEPATEVKMTLHDGYEPVLANIYAFSDGARQDWVQDWETPWDEADLLCFPTHSDDEFVFFGGVIPWAIDRGYRVQVAYIVKHTGYRRHEMLDSLWEAGVTHYPVTSDKGDIYQESVSGARAFYGTDHITEYIVEQLRRFKPLVVVGHDEHGDSGHSVHVFGVECLKAALEVSADATAYPDSAEKYGTWDVPKTYLHVYGDADNYTVLDFETPLAHYDGRTAFEVAEDAFAKCTSQAGMGKYKVFGSDSVHDTHLWGLYRTTVGEDLEKDDFFEHLC